MQHSYHFIYPVWQYEYIKKDKEMMFSSWATDLYTIGQTKTIF